MKAILVIIILSIFNTNSILEMHPIHISVSNIDYNETDQEYEISIKLFVDDFEKVINKNYNVKLNLGKENENTNSNHLITKYIQSNFKFNIDNKNILKGIKLSKKKVNLENNSIFIFYNIKHISGNKIIIKNTLMADLYDDQKNLFIFTYKNTEEAYKFEKNKTIFEFSIE